MGRHYAQLSLEERCSIACLARDGHSIRHIATCLDRSASTIWRELKRNSGVQVGYKPAYADAQAFARRWRGSRLYNAGSCCSVRSMSASGLVQFQAENGISELDGVFCG